MATTVTMSNVQDGSHGVIREHEAGSANTLLTTTTVGIDSKARKLLYVYTKYSAAPTQAGVTITLDSGISAAYDVLMNTGTANAQNNFYQPTVDIILFPGDQLVVAAPAAGAGITAQTVIVCEVIN